MLKRRALLLMLAAADAVRAGQWPERPLRLIVPFPAGSSPDLIARLIAEPLGRALGVNVLVDNRPGAGGNIGTAQVAKAAADGYTLLLTIQGPLVTAPLLTRRLPYDPQRELQPIGLIASSPNVLVCDAALGVQNLADFVQLVQRRKGELNYGSIGRGSAAHLAMEAFKRRARLDLVHVPYAGFPQVVNAMLAGQVQAAFMVPAIAMPQVRAGKLRALGLSSSGRVAALPELAPMSELGYPGFEAISWQAMLAPAGLPAQIAERLSAELQRIVKSDEFRSRLLALYFSVMPSAPEGLSLQMRSERERWARLIAEIGLQPE